MASFSIEVPDVLVPRVVAAMRATYPDLTAGKANVAAAKAVIAFWTRNMLASYEADQERQRTQAGAAAVGEQAWNDSTGIV